MNRFTSTIAAWSLAALAGHASAANDVVLTPAASTLDIGAQVQLQLRGQSFADLILGGGLNLQWDPAVLAFDGGTIDPAAWEFARNLGQLDAAAGTLTGMFFASFAGNTGSFPIATLTFKALQPGTTPIALSLFTDQPFANSLGQVVGVNLANASVSVVPEPAPWVLLALAGALWPLLRQRMTRA
jgi:hypothetical protein